MNYLKILSLVLLLFSCSKESGMSNPSIKTGTKNASIEDLRAVRSELQNKKTKIDNELSQIDEKIAKLDTSKKIPLVTSLDVVESEFKHYIELQGNTTTKKLMVVTPEYAGILAAIYVKENQFVSKGQQLAKVDDGGLTQQKSQIEIQLNLAKTTFERQKRLWEQKIGSEMQFLQAKTNYDVQKESINQIDAQLNKTIIRAPFSGVIDQIITEQGSVVAPGQSQILRILNLNAILIETNVPEKHIDDIKKNSQVIVEIPTLGKEIESKINSVSNFINPGNRSFKIDVKVPNKDRQIKPNLIAKLKINDYTNKKAILILQNIISEDSKGDQYVYTIEDRKGAKFAKKTYVKTGKTKNEFVEILDGLKQGEQIIIEGARSVENDQQVIILKEKDEQTK